MSEKDPNAPLPPGLPPPEEAGTQALSEALRSSFIIVKVIMVVLVIVFLGSGFFTVDSQHRAIILRLGRAVGTGPESLLGPGFHFAFPKPIDEVVMIPYTGQQRADSTVGWDQTPEERMRNADPPPALNSLDPRAVTYALSADTNIVFVNGTVRFTVNDPIRYHFDFVDSPSFVTNDLNNALIYACSKFNVDDMLTLKSQEFREEVTRRLEQLISEQQLGVQIQQVDAMVIAGRYLKEKFEGVLKANINRPKVHDQAVAVATKKLLQAEADASSITNKAEAERSRMVSSLKADATNFALFRADWERNPEMFKTVLLMPALERALASAKDIMVAPHDGDRQIRIHVSGQPNTPVAETNKFY